MKSVTVEELQADLLALLRLVASGEEFRVVREQKPVARLVPDTGVPGHDVPGPVDWSDTWAEVNAIFGGKPAPGKPGSRIVIEGRR